MQSTYHYYYNIIIIGGDGDGGRGSSSNYRMVCESWKEKIKENNGGSDSC